MTKVLGMILGSIVLAGGHGKRMGRPKEFLRWGDSTLLHETVLKLLDCTYPVVVVARDEQQDLPPLHTESELVFDSMPGEGPLVGILAGMERLEGHCDAAFVVGCDAPFVTDRVVGWLAEQLGDQDAVLTAVDGQANPLTAIYRVSQLETLRELVASGQRRADALHTAIQTGGGKVRTLSAAEVDAFDPERKFLQNLNSEQDYEQARREIGK